MKLRALLFWLLAVTFTAASLAWLFHVPDQPARLHRAIPVNASLVSAHHDINGRWDMWAAHPLVLELLEKQGVTREAVAKLGHDPIFRRLRQQVASHELLVAQVPEMRSTGEPAWVFAAWLGGHSQRVRWMLKSLRHPDLKRAATRNGWLVWVWTPRELKGQRVTFSLVEGMLVGCVAQETLGIDDVLAGLDGHTITLADRTWLHLTDDHASPDRGWYRDARGALFPFQLDLRTNAGARLRVETPWTVPAGPPSTNTGEVGRLDGFAQLISSNAVAAAVVDRRWVQSWLADHLTNAVGTELAALVQDDSQGPVALALLAGDYSGRFMAVRLPTLMAGLSGSPVAQNRFVLAAMDRLNARTRWGLVAAPVMVAAAPAFAIEATGESVYARLSREENIAYTPTADGLVFASNLATMDRLLRERAGQARGPSSRFSALLAGVQDGSVRVGLWFDAAEAAKVVRLGVTAWSLKLLLEDPQGSQPARQRLNEFKAWMDALAPLGQLGIEVAEQDQRAIITLDTGVP
jgi:hypothetical protein